MSEGAKGPVPSAWVAEESLEALADAGTGLGAMAGSASYPGMDVPLYTLGAVADYLEAKAQPCYQIAADYLRELEDAR